MVDALTRMATGTGPAHDWRWQADELPDNVGHSAAPRLATGVEVNLSLDLLLRATLDPEEAVDGVEKRGVRSWRCESPRAGLLGHEANRRVLHAGPRHAADQDDRPAGRVRAALLLRHGWR